MVWQTTYSDKGKYELMEPLVSVLMTSYNRELYIGAAIDSVLASTYLNFELIIVDDASKDGTLEIAHSYSKKDKRVKIHVNEKNLGDYPNRNKAASYATGKYIKYLDSDDIMYRHCLDVMVNCMEQFPAAGFGLCSVSDPLRPYPVCLSSKEVYLENFNGYGHFDRAPGSSIIKKEAFDKVGGFSGERMIGDTELWYRLALNYPMVKFVAGLYWSRTHDGQESQSAFAVQQYVQLHKMVLDRYFDNPGCPLSDEEKKMIRAGISRKKRKSALINIIKKLSG